MKLVVRAVPNASRSEIAGWEEDPRAGRVLRVRVAAPPVEGKANVALVRFLADAFGVPMRNVLIVRGETSRDKVVRVERPALRPDREWLP